jgi:hypothetical protein
MKTKQEMIYDFMLALAPNYYSQIQEQKKYCEEVGVEMTDAETIIEFMYLDASMMANYILKEFENEGV